MEFKNIVDNCGDESRVNNPILNALDLFTKDKHGMRDQYGQRQRQREPNHSQSNDNFISPQDFENFRSNVYAREFEKLNLNTQQRELSHHPRFGRYDLTRSQPNMHRQPNRRWMEEYHRADEQRDSEFEDFDRVFNSKSKPQQPHHRHMHSNQQRWADDFVEENNWRREFDQAYEKDAPSKFADDFIASEKDQVDSTEDWVDSFEVFDRRRRDILEKNLNGESMDWVEDFVDQDDEYDDITVEDFLKQNTKLHEYLFEEDNPYIGDPEAFEKGKDLFKEGMLSEAILAFESVVRADESHAEAWHYLGLVQAENDKDYQSSLALERAIKANPSNRESLVALAVTYTNNAQILPALQTLVNWISLNPEYAQLGGNINLTGVVKKDHNMVIDLFIKAARTRPNDPDPDVQIALGLLFNLEFNYEKGADCFRAALLKRPYDYSLWNKLGATLANHRKFEDAIDAYYHALNIKPSYTRARSNLGISFMSLREYGESAKGFLSALSINPNADHIWDNLRTVFILMDRNDLAEKCRLGDPSAFEDEFNF